MPPKNVAFTSNFARLRAADTPLLTKLAIGRISEDLMKSEKARNEFARDPVGVLETKYGLRPNDAEAEYFKDLAGKFADGFCCGGCVCGGAVATPADIHR